jgi:hypothetical protein
MPPRCTHPASATRISALKISNHNMERSQGHKDRWYFTEGNEGNERVFGLDLAGNSTTLRLLR